MAVDYAGHPGETLVGGRWMPAGTTYVNGKYIPPAATPAASSGVTVNGQSMSAQDAAAYVQSMQANAAGGANDPNVQNAAAALQSLFDSYGLGTLAPTILKLAQGGYNSDYITLQLQQTPEYKQRFAANDIRVKNGLRALSPAEYLATEQQYRQVMQSAGMPTGFYDQPSDFTNFISGDVSPSEVQSRVKEYTDLVYNAPPEAKAAFAQWYGTTSDSQIAAIAMDQNRALPLIQNQFQNAQIAGQGAMQGIGVGQGLADQIRQAGVSPSQAGNGFQQIATMQPTMNSLDNIYGSQGLGYNLGQAEAETFGLSGAGDAANQRRRLASQERAAFSGGGGPSTAALSVNPNGS